jgi:peptide-methionine (S)-S-oxide reductase
MFTLKRKPLSMPSPADALPGRAEAIPTATHHFVNGVPLEGPYPKEAEKALFGLGCFWGAERKFWTLPGVIVTAVGYGRRDPQPHL